MIRKNENYVIEIDSLGSEAQGIGKIDDLVIFVEKGLPGDVLEIKIIKVKKNYGVGKLIEIITPSPNRTNPTCNISSKCGGCNFHEFSYSAELDYKKDKVYNSLKRIGGIDTKVENCLGMKNPFYYRNKAQFPVRENENGEIEIGFYRKRSHKIVPLKKCIIQHRINKDILDIIEKFLIKNKIKAYNEITGKGLVRHIVTRVGFSTNEVMVCLVINGKTLPSSEELIKNLTTLEEIKSIVLNVNQRNDNVILGDEIINLYGNNYITDKLNNITFKISPLSFYQVNPIQTEVLYNIVLENLNLKGNEIVFDAFCGIGTISLCIARSIKKVYGIEIVKEAIIDADENAILNEISNVEFIHGDSAEEIKKLFEERKITPNIIIVDPPRKGCDENLLNSILEIEPEKIAYISCDPATLARDLKILLGKDLYEIKLVQPVDCFGKTFHIETIVILEKQSKK